MDRNNYFIKLMNEANPTRKSILVSIVFFEPETETEPPKTSVRKTGICKS